MKINIDKLCDVNLYKSFVANLDDDQIDELGDDYTSCWVYAYYVHVIVGLPINNCDCIYENHITNIDDICNILAHDGIHSFYHSNKTEFHHFICVIDGDTLLLLATYGGQNNFIKKIINKNQWLADFLDLFKDDSGKNKIEQYKQLFGITNKIMCLDLSQCVFMNSSLLH